MAGAAVLAASLCVSALLAEGLLRWVFHAAPLLDLDIYYFDAARNLRMQPEARRRHVTRQWDVTIAINDEGFRDRPEPVKSRARPILGLGDSFAFGWGVNLEQTYLYLVEEGLARKSPIRIIKMGTPGTGPGDQLRLLETIGGQYKAQLVIVSFFVGNDFTDVQMGGTEQFDVKDGLMIRHELRPPSRLAEARNKLIRSSHLLQFLRAVEFQWRQHRAAAAGRGIALSHTALLARDPWLYEFSKVHWRDYPPETARGVALTLETLDRIRNYCRLHDSDFLLMVIPRSYQIYPDELEQMETVFQIPDQSIDLDRPQRVLQDWAARREAAILDLLPPFRRYHAEHPSEKLYYYPDAHFNAAGHALAANLLAEFLDRNGLPRER